MQGDSKFFVWVLVVAALVVGGLVLFSQSKSTTNGVIDTAGHKRGPDSASVKIVEFSDYQCPACATVPPIIDEVLQKNPEKVQLIVKYFPLPSHQYSQQAAQAVEAASKQNKFWEMHELIFKNQQKWEVLSNVDSAFRDYAASLSLNLDQFDRDYKSSETKATIAADLKYGEDIGVNSTPTFYINNKKYEGNRSVTDWQAIIDAL